MPSPLLTVEPIKGFKFIYIDKKYTKKFDINIYSLKSKQSKRGDLPLAQIFMVSNISAAVLGFS